MSGRGRGGRGRGGKLSDRFTQLQFKSNTAVTHGREGRRIVTQQTQKNKRQAMQNATRFGGNPKKAAQGVKLNVGGGRGGRGRGGGRGFRGGRGGGGGRGRGRGRGGEKKTKLDKDALDMEMDEYHFKAGKGPDPKQARLDRDMEDYWKTKKTGDTATPAADDDGDAEAS